MIWRDGENERVFIGGTGVISCRGLTEEQGLEAEAKKHPLGFRVEERVTRLGRLELAARIAPAWGEAGWTARDLLAGE